jgi:hypothetical protein
MEERKEGGDILELHEQFTSHLRGCETALYGEPNRHELLIDVANAYLKKCRNAEIRLIRTPELINPNIIDAQHLRGVGIEALIQMFKKEKDFFRFLNTVWAPIEEGRSIEQILQHMRAYYFSFTSELVEQPDNPKNVIVTLPFAYNGMTINQIKVEQLFIVLRSLGLAQALSSYNNSTTSNSRGALSLSEAPNYRLQNDLVKLESRLRVFVLRIVECNKDPSYRFLEARDSAHLDHVSRWVKGLAESK